MKEIFIKDLPKEGMATFFAAVQKKEIRKTKKEKDYVSFSLIDKTGSVDGKIWDDVEELVKLFDNEDIVKVQGMMGSFAEKAQITVKKIKKAEPQDIDASDYLPRSIREPQEMYDEIVDKLKSQDHPCTDLALAIIQDDDIKPRLLRSPAAMRIHHAMVGGLLEHISNLMNLCDVLWELYAFRKEVVYAACVLHDIGKCWELDVKLSFSYSTVGNLIGHIGLGMMLIDKFADKLKTPEEWKLKLLHAVASHHGTIEHGALKIPSTREAVIFHQMDALDARMATVSDALRDAEGDSDFTNYSSALGTYMYRK